MTTNPCQLTCCVRQPWNNCRLNDESNVYSVDRPAFFSGVLFLAPGLDFHTGRGESLSCSPPEAMFTSRPYWLGQGWAHSSGHWRSVRCRVVSCRAVPCRSAVCNLQRGLAFHLSIKCCFCLFECSAGQPHHATPRHGRGAQLSRLPPQKPAAPVSGSFPVRERRA